jgi:CHAT domain-containing protein
VSGEEKHLTIEQIERLHEMWASASGRSDEPDLLSETRRHLAHCNTCQNLVSVEKERDRALQALRQQSPAPVSGDCSPEIKFYELVAGVMSGKDSETLLKHASECDRCGPILRQATEQLRTEQTDEESGTIAALETSRPEWQERLSRRLASAAPVDENARLRVPTKIIARMRFLKLGWAVAAVALLSLLVLGVSAVWKSSPSYAERLLATAYAENRTIEVRIPGARHAPSPATRGPHPALRSDRPQALRDAEHLIDTRLSSNSSDVRWLQARVREDLLDENFDDAVQTAEQALGLQPDSVLLLNDLGSAYYERAASKGDPDDTDPAKQQQSALDYGRAYEFLSRSLAANPDDRVVLFNRALAAEGAHLYGQAESDWNHYLQIESDPAWQSEARTRLERVELKLRENKNHSQRRLDGPYEVAEALSSGNTDQIEEVDSVADDYLELAVKEWIPQLASGRVLDSNRLYALRTAANLLGEDLRVRHADSWLSDFLSEPSLTHDSQAIELLVRAMSANDNGNHESAIQLAYSAEAAFQKSGSEPGRIRAAFETIYSSRLAAHGKECHDRAAALVDEARDLNYGWIEIQARLEAAACAAEVSNIDESLAGSQKAKELAQLSKYGNLKLRATVFAADLSGDINKRLGLVAAGLVTFWGGRYQPMRGYSLYTVIDTTAADLNYWYWDKAAIEEGLRLIEADPDLALKGLDRYRLARAELGVGEIDAARHTSAEARALLESGSSQALVSGACIELAEAYVTMGRYRDALEMLDSAEPNLDTLTQDVVLAEYYSVRAAALIGEGQDLEAERALVPALRLAKKGLLSISEERDRFAWLQSFEPIYASLADLQSQKDVESAFRWWEAFRGASITRASADELIPTSILDAPTALPAFNSWPHDGTLFLSYATFPEGIAVWGFDGRQVHGRWLPGSKTEINSLAERFYEGCAHANSDPAVLTSQGQRLYDLLIRPVSEWLQGRSRLIFETDNSLQSVPFEALVDGHGTYLSDSFEIEYSPGISYLVQNQRPDRIGHGSRALVIGESFADVQNALPPIPDALDEAREVAARFDKPTFLLDNGATLANIRQQLPASEIFHFAGHAIGNRELSGLLLAPATKVGASRLLSTRDFNARLLSEARLVVLSSCSTANGIGIGVNDRDSLARNALVAGVTTVVASRWLVNSVATREWMNDLYENAVAGERIGFSANRARMKLRSKVEWRHPFYWASFSVFV